MSTGAKPISSISRDTTALVVILVVAPGVYDQALRFPGGEHALPVLSYLAAISTFLGVLVIGVVRRWRWTFWLILGTFLIGGGAARARVYPAAQWVATR